MKKITLLSLFVFVFGIINAQKSQFGIKGGLNISNQTNIVETLGAPQKSSSIIGFNIGGFVEIKISDKFSVQPELLYSTQGGKLNSEVFLRTNPEEPGELFDVEFKSSLSYVNIPVMFKYYVVKKLSLELGPQLGILVGSKIKQTLTSQNTGQTSSNDDSGDFYNSIDYGMNIGTAYAISKNISAEIRYSIGLSNISKRVSNESKNSVFSISAFYKF